MRALYPLMKGGTVSEKHVRFPEEFTRVLEAWASGINKAFDTVQKVVDEPKRMLQSFGERNAELLEALRSFDVVFPALVEDMLFPMVSLGWYPDIEMPFSNLSAVVDLFKTDSASAEREYAAFLSTELTTVRERLTLAAPTRARVLKEGFEAHAQKLFFASTPVFLAQAEGLVREQLGAALYSRKRLRQRVTELEAENWGLSEVLMLPLLEPTDINKTEGERLKGFSGLNRHAVLHGVDTTYGTEWNSLKAISHLLFVSDVLGHVDKQF